MKLAFIFFIVLSSVSAQSVFAGRNRRSLNIFAAAGGAKNSTGANANNNTAAAAAAANNNTAAAAAANNSTGSGGGGGGGANGGDPQTSTTLDPQVISKGFEQNGQNPPVTGQTASLTSSNNFINFCLPTLNQFPLTDGKQLKGGSCNDVVVGLIPPASKMVSTIILFPQDGDVVKPNSDFQIKVLSTNIKLGVFTNAQTTYLAAPQTLDPGTNEIVGHTHVTVQAITSKTAPPDPTQFAFFKGINSPADAQGQVAADVTGGLPAGDYRVCTMTSAANHQPVVMPIAQRGSQDDCTRFTVSDQAGGNNGTNSSGGSNNAAAGGSNNAAVGGNNATNTNAAGGNNSTNTSAAGGNNATATGAAGGNNAANNGAGNNGAGNNGAAGGNNGNKGAGGGQGAGNQKGKKGKRWFN